MEAQTKGRSEGDIVKNETNFEESVTKEDTLKLFAKSIKILQMMERKIRFFTYDMSLCHYCSRRTSCKLFHFVNIILMAPGIT